MAVAHTEMYASTVQYATTLETTHETNADYAGNARPAMRSG
ncbi:MAG TPA: hypothetical protein VFU63_08520 [Ktedonobacterales bacterium]|nr:hypothetical protein [Ktedonobacterales bacterium]